MRRFWTIIFFVVLYLAWGTSDIAIVSEAGRGLSADVSLLISSRLCSDKNLSDSQQQELSDIADLMHRSLRSCSYEFQQSIAAHAFYPHQLQHNSSTRHNLRHRSLGEKIMSEAVHSRHAGHITRIFEFNPFRSSLRVAFYLHTLCRLRI